MPRDEIHGESLGEGSADLCYLTWLVIGHPASCFLILWTWTLGPAGYSDSFGCLGVCWYPLAMLVQDTGKLQALLSVCLMVFLWDRESKSPCICWGTLYTRGSKWLGKITQLFYLEKQCPAYMVTIFPAGTSKGDVQGHRVSVSWDMLSWTGRREVPNRGNGQEEAGGGVLKCHLYCPRRLWKWNGLMTLKGS